MKNIGEDKKQADEAAAKVKINKEDVDLIVSIFHSFNFFTINFSIRLTKWIFLSILLNKNCDHIWVMFSIL